MTSAVNLDTLRAVLASDRFAERDGIAVVTPHTTDEIAAITRHTHENGLAIEIVGSGTKRGWGNPVAADLLLDTTRLNRVLEHPWQDLTCTVQAGCTWSVMQQELARHNQFVALDPLWPDRATVGGIVATNDSGALRHRYGSLRDLIIGMTIVLADGTMAKTGGKVVKNVAGYDLHKLMTGAFGTLGIIAEVTFRLHPLPRHTQTFTVSSPQAAQLAPLIAAIRSSHLLTQALQLRGDSTEFHLDIQLNAHSDANQPDILARMVQADGLALEAISGEVWTTRDQLFNQANNIVFKATMSPADVPGFTHVLSSYGGSSVTQSCGIMTAAFDKVADASFHRLREEFEAKGGSLTLLQRCDGNPSFGNASLSLPLMREIKHQFDPNRILNPGRFLGGI